ncbi:MAG: hypothetical protein KKG76_09665 [Euryarchaeota archaeon]|nr:hypothetical protein [Euryarchaeota archaeon]MBU4140255.1 hypothetical protein [Euryarchaeota archaeon]
MQIKNETYKSINVFTGELRTEMKRPVSMDEAIKRLLNFKKKKAKPFCRWLGNG